MLGSLQGVIPQAAFLVTRDHPFNPLPIAVDHELGGPLDPETADLIKNYQWIARNGGRVTPWSCPLVRPNFANHEDAPWLTARRVSRVGRSRFGSVFCVFHEEKNGAGSTDSKTRQN